MLIQIAQKFSPFSRRPGCRLLIPGSLCEVEVFPTLVRFYDLGGCSPKKIREIPIETCVPHSDFAVFQDLERGCITVFAQGMRYHILPSCELIFDKKPGRHQNVEREKLSLGMHKKQEFEEMRKRLDFREIFPLWHQLGNQLTLPETHKKNSGMFSFLSEWQNVIQENRPERLLPLFKSFFLASFGSCLVPRLYDNEHQGIIKEEGGDRSPLYLLTEGAKLIRSLFIYTKNREVHLLPHVPPEFHAGRFIHVKTPFGEFDMEWTKKTLRQLVFRSIVTMPLQLKCDLKRCRFRSQKNDRGTLHRCDELFEVEENKIYFFDRFEN